jgi:hypothetical protein
MSVRLDHEHGIPFLTETHPVECQDRPGDERYQMTRRHEATQ